MIATETIRFETAMLQWKNRATSLLLAALLCLATQASAQNLVDESAVRESFLRYRDAILNSDADAAFNEINQNTRDYYAEMLDNIWYASAEEIDTMTVVDKLFIAQSRHRIPVQQLKEFDEESYFKYAVDAGWIGAETVEKIELLNVAIDGDTAMSTFVRDGRALPFGFSFNLEDGGWKIDLVSIIPLSNMGLVHAVNNSGYEEEEFIFKVVESLSGFPVDSQIWIPPLTR